MRLSFIAGTYKGHNLYDELCAREDLKRIIFENRIALAGSKPAVVVEHHTGSVFHALRWGFLREGVVIAVIPMYKGNYQFQMPPKGTAAIPDLGELVTKRRFLAGCSLCGGRDLYQVGQLRLCAEHKGVGLRGLKIYKSRINSRQSAWDKAEDAEDRRLRKVDAQHRLSLASKGKNRQL